MELEANGQHFRRDVTEDYTQHEVKYIIEWFKQRPGEAILSLMVCLHDQGVSG